MTDSTSKLGYLTCDHCGDVAIYGTPTKLHPEGLFSDSSGTCLSCGMPGHTDINEYDESEDDEMAGAAEWIVDDYDDNVCNNMACEECGEIKSAILARKQNESV